MKKHNFSAGPCILPREVIQKSANALLEFNNTGLSLIEISHRSKEFVEVMEKARSIVKRLMRLSDDYDILYLQGGASLQFIMTAYNLLGVNEMAAYLDTGTWSNKAIKEAKKLGKVCIVASSKDENYTYIPKGFIIPENASYFHCTSNNTIYGTQIQDFIFHDKINVCDMSSDIFSREIDFTRFDLIYAGAQKNMGPAGATLVVIKKELFGKSNRNIPSYLDYQIHSLKESMFNTPSVFAVYTSLLTLEWLETNGGIKKVEERNDKKAQLIYDEIDRNYLFKGVVEKSSRSRMNATFVLNDLSIQEEFDRKCLENGIYGLKGHRSIGGYRASMYNALDIDSVQVLVDIMKSCER